MFISCPHQMSRFTHSMFYSKCFCVNSNSLNVLNFVMNSSTLYIGTLQCFDISRELGDRMRLRLITKRDRELVPHICSYHINKHENHWFNASKVAVKEIWTREYDNTVKLYLRILTCYNPITRVNKPSYHKTRFKQFKYNLDDSKFEVHDIKPVSSIT